LEKPVYNRIAVCIDFSSVDTLSIRSAIGQGGAGASYLLIHIVETAGAMWYGSEIADHESSEDTNALKNYTEQVRAQGYHVEMKIGFGNPKKVIPEVATAFEADLLVMGAHGHNWVKDLAFGTTVDTVRHRIGIPVLIVREQ
jgi:manganese transport protein